MGTIIDMEKLRTIAMDTEKFFASHNLNPFEKKLVIDEIMRAENLFMKEVEENALFQAKKNLGGMN